MKKILLLLLLSVAMYGQVPADATPLENIQITNNVQDNTATKVTVQSGNNVVNWIYKDSLKKTDTDKVKNNSFVSGSTATDALNYLSANKENVSNKIYDLSGGIKPPDNYPSANAVVSEINSRFNSLSDNDVPRTGIQNDLIPGSLSDNGLFVTSINPIKIPNGMSSDDAVNKGQLDTKSNINSPVFTGVPQVPEPTISQSPVTKNYADNLVVGLLNDRGSYDASTNLFPTTGGSGGSGEIRKGDMWFVSVAGTLGGKAVTNGDSFRALVNTPAQTASNWSVLEANIGYVPENQSNKSSSYTLTSTTTYPDTKALVDGLTTKENIFSKNTAFNKNFGTTAGSVAEGNDSRILNGQTAFGWGNHTNKYLQLNTNGGGIVQISDGVDANNLHTMAGYMGGAVLNTPGAGIIYTLMNTSNLFGGQIHLSNSGDLRFRARDAGVNTVWKKVWNSSDFAAVIENTGAVIAAGKFNTTTTTPIGTTRLNYEGYFYPTRINTAGTPVTSTAFTHVYGQTASDGFVRPKTIADFRTELVTTAAVDAAKPNIALTTSPVFTGFPTAPTAPAGTNTTQIATTEFVLANSVSDINALHKTGNELFTGVKSAVSTGSGKTSGIDLTHSGTGSYGVLVVNNSSDYYGGVFTNTGTVLSAGVYSTNSNTGAAIVANGLTPSTGSVYKGQNNGVDTFTVDKFGKIITNSTVTASPATVDTELASLGQVNKNRLISYTFATLPASPTQGDSYAITDALTPTYLGAAVGGGAVYSPVVYNGTIWVCH